MIEIESQFQASDPSRCKDQAQHQDYINSSILIESPGTSPDLQDQSKIGYHLLQYLIEPILIFEPKFKFYAQRRQKSRMEVIQFIRSRIGFFPLYNLYDQVELKKVETDITMEIQQRHSFRIQ